MHTNNVLHTYRTPSEHYHVSWGRWYLEICQWLLLMKIKEQLPEDNDLANEQDIQARMTYIVVKNPSKIQTSENQKNELSIGRKIVLKGWKVIIHKSQRVETLKKIYEDHLCPIL